MRMRFSKKSNEKVTLWNKESWKVKKTVESDKLNPNLMTSFCARHVYVDV